MPLFVVTSPLSAADQPELGDVRMSRMDRMEQIERLRQWRAEQLERLDNLIGPLINANRARYIRRDERTFGLGMVILETSDIDAEELIAQGLNVEQFDDRRFVPPSPRPAPGPIPQPDRPPKRNLWHFAAVGLDSAALRRRAFTGRGVTVAVIDTGIDATHPGLQGKILRSVAFDANGREAPPSQDSTEHGTYVTGLICDTHAGIAPGASVIDVQVMRGGSGTIPQVLAGLEWAAQANVDIFLMCIGMEGASEIFRDVIHDLTRFGSIFIVPVGNDGAGRVSGVVAPDSVSVGATTRRNVVAKYSGGGPPNGPVRTVPTLAAPGQDICSCRSGGGYTRWSGTSPAAAITAGVAALLWERQSERGNDEMREALISSCRDLGQGPDRQGHGLIQVGDS